MADPIQELNEVFAMCGIQDNVMRDAIILLREGFTQLGDLGVLETDAADVSEMPKRMAMRTLAEGQVLLGTVIIKQLQMLVWWVRDHQKHGLALVAANFNDKAMAQASEMKMLKRERAEKEPSITNLGKFNPDGFNAHEDAFKNLLAPQLYGVLKEPLLHYVVHPATMPTDFVSTEEEQMYQYPHTGNSFELDNQAVYRKLKAFLIDSPGWAWIEPHDTAKDSRVLYAAGFS